ncbi:hypothetical protein CsSME_00020014 [Camellia sinensis var. sinensis]
MAADMETMKRRIKGKEVATEEGCKGSTHSYHLEDRDRQVTPSQAESKSLRTDDIQSKASRTRYSRSERMRTERSYTEGSSYRPSHLHQTHLGTRSFLGQWTCRQCLRKGPEGEKTFRLATPAESPHYNAWLLEHMGVSRLECQSCALPMNQQTNR